MADLIVDAIIKIGKGILVHLFGFLNSFSFDYLEHTDSIIIKRKRKIIFARSELSKRGLGKAKHGDFVHQNMIQAISVQIQWNFISIYHHIQVT